MRILLRVILFLLSLEIFLRIGGMVSLSIQDYQNNSSLANKGAYRIMCVGESTTFAGGKDSYPSQLERVLKAHYPGRTFEVINRGIPGSNSADIAARLKSDLGLYKPNMVIAMVGINDNSNTIIYQDRWTDRLSVQLGNIRLFRILKFLWAHIQTETKRLLNHDAELSVEERLKKEIRRHPKGSGAYVELGQYLFENKKYSEAEDIFRRAIKINPKKDWPYEQLAKSFILQGRYQDAEDVFKRSLKKNVSKSWAYASLSRFYQDQDKPEAAERVLTEGVSTNPGDLDIYIELAAFYQKQGQFVKAQKILEQAISIDPKNSNVYAQLGYCYGEQERYDEMEVIFQQATDLATAASVQKKLAGFDLKLIMDLSDWYMKRHEAGRAVVLLEKVLSTHPDNAQLMRGLANIYSQSGKREEALAYQRKAEELSEQKPLLATQANYRKIVQIAQEQGVAMVSISYAMRDVAPLKKMLGVLDGVIFVDNGDLFKKALIDGKYEDYFTDFFAGDFGHFTPKGARLLAEHVSQSIANLLK